MISERLRVSEQRSTPLTAFRWALFSKRSASSLSRIFGIALRLRPSPGPIHFRSLRRSAKTFAAGLPPTAQILP